MRVKRTMAMVASGLFLAGLPLTAADARESYPSSWGRLMEEVAAFQDRLWGAPGWSMHDDYSGASGSTAVDLTSGYSQTGETITHFAGAEYSPIEASRSRAALRVLQTPRAQWQFEASSPDGGDLAYVSLPIQWLALDTGRPRSVTWEGSADGSLYRLDTREGPVTVQITAQRLALNAAERDVTWTLGSFPVAGPAPEAVVSSADFWDAQAALSLREQGRASVRAARAAARNPKAWGPVRSMRTAARRSAQDEDIRVDSIPNGVRITARNRYIHRIWRVAWSPNDGTTVRRRNAHPRGWVPPRRPVVVPPASSPTTLGVQVLRQWNRAAVADLNSPGMELVSSMRLSDGVTNAHRAAFARNNDVVAFLNDGGTPVAVRGASGRECYALDPTSRLDRRALALAGRPNAAWSCAVEGDTDLSWLAAIAPSGFVVPASRVLFDPSLTQEGEQYTMGSGRRSYRLRFEGEYIREIERGSVGASAPDGLRLAFEYGPQILALPDGNLRIPRNLLLQAQDAVRARSSVRVRAAQTRRCAQARIRKHKDPIAAIHACASESLRKANPTFYDAISNGVSFYVRTRFSLDSRDVIWSGSGVIVTNVVHRWR